MKASMTDMKSVVEESIICFVSYIPKEDTTGQECSQRIKKLEWDLKGHSACGSFWWSFYGST